MKAIILAAGVGKRFGRQTEIVPKCLIPLGRSKENLLSRYFDSFRNIGLKEVVIICGHKMGKIEAECKRSGKGLNIRLIFNEQYKKGSILSLYCAEKELKEDCLIMDADVYFPDAALKKLIHSKQKSAFLADTKVKSTGEEQMLMAKNGRLISISKKIDPSLTAVGESIGFLKLNKTDALLLRKILKKFVDMGKVNIEHEDTYPVLMQKREIGFENMNGFFWSEMDFKKDLRKILKNLNKQYPFETSQYEKKH